METTIGKELSRIRLEAVADQTYRDLSRLELLKEDAIKVISDNMFAAAKKGWYGIELDASMLINEKYHDTVRKDLRSKDKVHLINNVVKFLSIAFRDVHVEFVKDKLFFSWA